MQIATRDVIDRVRTQWAKEHPELDTSPMEIVGRIFRAEHLADAALRRSLRRHGLDRGGLDVLATLRRSGAPYQLTPTQLYEELVLTSGAITHRVDVLERAGLVKRTLGQRDRRSTPVGLTASGVATVKQVMGEYLEREWAMIAHLTSAERSTLASSLRKLLVGMEERHAGD